ncbi:YdcF family protein [Desemzia sp. RIT804]|uniref:ElyC/SanA/YdcF family protein n=1 Tax=Desemzia sp. RIT 804 TaxID=2810209 RepID=UPI001950A4A6|nr:YdcF family protein [Desemzia sp. RIT 804]MBM6614987.1 YdcF family protein [Desemzia sp. RIT 804]
MFSEKVEIKNYQGEVDTTRLIPLMGSSFNDIEELKEVVHLLERWQYKSALDELDHRIHHNIQLIDSLLLKGEVLALFDDNQAAIEVFETILRKDSQNIYALVMILIQLIIVQGNKKEMEQYFNTLKTVSPKIHHKLKEVLVFIENNKTNFDVQKVTEPLDLICVFGYFLNNDGSMPIQLEKRLLKVCELVKIYPKAKVLLSGGAVQNKYGEAVEMKKYLVAAGISEEKLVALEKAKDTVGNILEFIEYIRNRKFNNICVVTSIEHLPRAWMSLYTGLKRWNYDSNLFGTAPEEMIVPEILEKEFLLNYQTILRVAGLFEKKDIECQL